MQKDIELKLEKAKLSARAYSEEQVAGMMTKALDRGIKGTGYDETRNTMLMKNAMGRVRQKHEQLEMLAQKELIMAEALNKHKTGQAKDANIAALKTKYDTAEIQKIMKEGTLVEKGNMIMGLKHLSFKKRQGLDMTAREIRQEKEYNTQLKNAERTQVMMERMMAQGDSRATYYDKEGKLTKAGNKLIQQTIQDPTAMFAALGDKGVELLTGQTDATYAFIKEMFGTTGENTKKIQDDIAARIAKAKKAGTKVDMTAILMAVQQENKLIISKAVKEGAKVDAPSIKEQAKSIADRGFKVSKKDINNIKDYKVLLQEFATAISDSKLEEKFKPFADGMARLSTVFKDKDAASGLDKASTFFFQLRGLKTKHAKIIEQVTTSAEGNIKKISEAEIAWQRLKIAIDDTEKSTAGQLFFKGGTITQNVNATTTVRLVVGGKDFGNAALEGLKMTEKITIP